ncbi:3-keto-disaccharide hydrolase [Granulicella arctica]|uniref:3-keto-disaccharide hydrolase n=1 Tax=Granulicella arctica TaxID=940613 RepID=UPI0021E0B531|nr:DUF1080 domain-containing protein [Granulicella arctica]
MSIRAVFLVATVLFAGLPALAQAPNTLTQKEAAGGWRLLWDGKTPAGWRSSKDVSFPTVGWELKDGLLNVTDTSGEEGSSAVDIITTDAFTNFELSVDFRITTGANSGIKYFVDPAANGGKNATIGFEYQILDDAVHPDAKKGKDGDRTQASLYDMIAPAKGKPERPIGAWNTARIVVRGAHGEHWLNGVKVVEYERFTPQFRQLVADSKYHVYPGFGEARSGHILLQDHGFPVSFRNIKIRELPATPSK